MSVTYVHLLLDVRTYILNNVDNPYLEIVSNDLRTYLVSTNVHTYLPVQSSHIIIRSCDICRYWVNLR